MQGMAGEASTAASTGVGPERVVRLSAGSFQMQQHKVSPSSDVVIADHVLWRYDQASLQALSKRLTPGMVLLFLEPTAELGWRRLLHRNTQRLTRLLLRHNFSSDVPAELREAGLIVTTTIRFNTGPGGWRSYVLGRAEHFSET